MKREIAATAISRFLYPHKDTPKTCRGAPTIGAPLLIKLYIDVIKKLLLTVAIEILNAVFNLLAAKDNISQ